MQKKKKRIKDEEREFETDFVVVDNKEVEKMDVDNNNDKGHDDLYYGDELEKTVEEKNVKVEKIVEDVVANFKINKVEADIVVDKVETENVIVDEVVVEDVVTDDEEEIKTEAVVVDKEEEVKPREGKREMTLEERAAVIHDEKIKRKGYLWAKKLPKACSSRVRQLEEESDEEEYDEEMFKILDLLKFEEGEIARASMRLNPKKRKSSMKSPYSQKRKKILARKKPRTTNKATQSFVNVFLNFEMKSFFLKRGFSGKQFRRMRTSTMEKHV